jgi:hypothetical protein
MAFSFSHPLALSGSFYLKLGYRPLRKLPACIALQKLGIDHAACQRFAGQRNYQLPFLCLSIYFLFAVLGTFDQVFLGQKETFTKMEEKYLRGLVRCYSYC